MSKDIRSTVLSTPREDRVSVSLLGDLQNHSPGCDDLVRFCSFRRHRSRDDLAGRDGIAKHRVLRAAATTDSCDTSEGNPEGSLFAFTDAFY
jgi:hypothetical protein